MTRSELEIIYALAGCKSTIGLARLLLADGEFMHYVENRIPAHLWTNLSKEEWTKWRERELDNMARIINNRKEKVT